MRFGMLAAAMAVASCGLSIPASAAIITQTIDVTAVSFKDQDGITGSESFAARLLVKYDNEFEGQGYRVFSMGLPGFITRQVRVYYDVGQDILTLGTKATVSGYSLGLGDGDIGFFIRDVSSAPYITNVDYTDKISTNVFTSSRVTVAITPGGYPVPEPATWAFMIIGLGAVGGALRRRKPSQATVIRTLMPS